MCDQADESILETAAISAAPVNGGPELLVIFVVLKKGFNSEPNELKIKFSKAIQRNLNPLFKVSELFFQHIRHNICFTFLYALVGLLDTTPSSN